MFLSYSIIHLSGYVGENQRLTGGRTKSEASDGDLKIKLPPFAICRQYLSLFARQCFASQLLYDLGVGWHSRSGKSESDSIEFWPDTRFLSRTVCVKRIPEICKNYATESAIQNVFVLASLEVWKLPFRHHENINWIVPKIEHWPEYINDRFRSTADKRRTNETEK